MDGGTFSFPLQGFVAVYETEPAKVRVFAMKIIITLMFMFVSFFLAAEDIDINEKKNRHNDNEVIEYDLSGFALEIGFLNYFTVGVGYKWGTGSTFSHHFVARDYGFFIKYKTRNELDVRFYYDFYGGSAGMLLGASGIVATNFENITVGLAPHIGMGVPGMKLFYRYNFYLDSSFNCHEVVFAFSRGFDRNRRK